MPKNKKNLPQEMVNVSLSAALRDKLKLLAVVRGLTMREQLDLIVAKATKDVEPTSLMEPPSPSRRKR